MKRLLPILLLIATTQCFSQDNNALILDYVNSHYGKKVGEGVCLDLLYGASSYADSVNGFRDSVMDDVKPQEIKPGDIIDFRNVVFSNGDVAEKHVAILYEVYEDGIMTIAQQNVGYSKGGKKIKYDGEKVMVVKDSHVILSTLDPSTIVGGEISFYRFRNN